MSLRTLCTGSGFDIIYDVRRVRRRVGAGGGGMVESPADRCLRHCGLPHRSAGPGARSGSPDATTQALGEGIFQVRFYVGRIAERITYFFAGERRIVLLTRFAKQRV